MQPKWEKKNMCMLSNVQFFVTPWTVALLAPLSVGFSRQEYQSGCHFLLQGIFSTQGWNRVSCISCLVRQILYYCATWEAQERKSVSSVQSLNHVRLFATPWIAAHQASLSITNSGSLLKPMPIESVMPSSHLILCRPLLLLPPVPPSIRVFSSESALCMRWPKYWSFKKENRSLLSKSKICMRFCAL